MKSLLRRLIIFAAASGLISAIVSSILTPTPIFGVLSLLKYFTIWSNLFVLFYFVFINQKWRLLQGLKGSVYINISLTMIIFITLLSYIYHPSGLDLYTSLMHHYFVPPLSLVYLFKFESSDHIELSYVKKWLIFPLGYLLFSIIYYYTTKEAIYPFMAINEIGIGLYSLSLASMIILYLSLSFGLVKIVSRK